MLKNVALLGAETARTRAYLDALRAADLMPKNMVLLRRKTDASAHDIVQTATGVNVTLVEAEDVNDPAIVQAIAALPEQVVIFSGPGGAIVRQALFGTGKRFLHVHPGRLPEFRGSTTIYYSLLKENRVQASAILLEEGIDTGPVIGEASFAPPADRTEIDRGYDADIRAKLLVRVLQDYRDTGRFGETPQPPADDPAYYIIHPVLKHLAILAK